MEIVVILVVALLVLGPDKLPNVMRTIGKAVGELRRASTEFQRTIHTEIGQRDVPLSHPTFAPEEEAPAREPASAAPETSASGRSAAEKPDPDKSAPGKPSLARAARKRPLPRAPRSRRARSRKNGDTGDA